MSIFGHKVTSITINPIALVFLGLSIVLVKMEIVDIWTVVLICLSHIQLNMEFPIK